MNAVNLVNIPNEDESKLIGTALGNVCTDFPYLSGLAAAVDIRIDPRIPTAAVTPSGKILIGKVFFERLSLLDLAIILAHELLHLFRESHRRAKATPYPELVNIADDLIINDIIRNNVSMGSAKSVLDIGLNWREFRSTHHLPNTPVQDFSLEKLVFLLHTLPDGAIRRESWVLNNISSTLAAALCEAGFSQHFPLTEYDSFEAGELDLDLFSEEIERKLFPDEVGAVCRLRALEISKLARKAVVEAATMARLCNFRFPGANPSNVELFDNMLQGTYQTPWEAALQRWIDSIAPGERSWARPSRRGMLRNDVVLPGRKHEGWLLHLVLDTSKSMNHELSKALGAIASFCENNNIETVHLIQNDTHIQKDDYVTLDELRRPFFLHGFGGTDFASTFCHLAADPQINAVVVLTDGYFDPPPEPPFGVLWATVGYHRPSVSYGTVIAING